MLDINLSEGDFIINDEPSLIIQQIDLLFDTKEKEVFGAEAYGTKYDEFLFNTNLSNSAIEYQIMADLGSLELFGYTPHVDVNILEGTLNDIILITIGLSKNNTYYEKTYKLS